MSLTIKQENFCLKYIETGNASEAYRHAYDTSRMKPETVNRCAKEMIDHPNISARVKELREPVVKAAQVSLEQHLADLQRLRDKAESSEKYGPAVTAEMARGKASGLYVDKIELSVNAELAARLKNARARTRH
jgi:phage terminase small subunit